MHLKRRWALRHSLRGFLLAEALVVLLILGLASAFAVPVLWDWQEGRQLDMAAAELASAIREAEMEARGGSDGISSSVVTFYCNGESDGRVVYETKRGTKMITPKGKLHKNVVAGGSLKITFRKDTFAGTDVDSKYSMFLRTKDLKYEYQIIVAMYTGRVRVVKTKG